MRRDQSVRNRPPHEWERIGRAVMEDDQGWMELGRRTHDPP